MKHLFFLSAFFFTITINLFSIPENYEARSMMCEYITAPRSDVLSFKEKIIEQFSDGSQVRFEIKQQNESFYIIFINELENRFPIYSPGTYIIKRNLKDGKFVQIKVFLKADKDCYARIYPLDERAVLEVYLYGKRVYYEINLPQSFADVLTAPFSEIIDATSAIIDWDILLGKTNLFLYQNKIDIVKQIEEYLPYLNYIEDGAIDFDEQYIYIENLEPQPKQNYGLNCSGFVKWVADGIFFRETGKYLSVKELKKKHTLDRGNRWSYRNEEDRDPYFGLDWSRNIAVSIANVQTDSEYNYKSADVTALPWSSYTPDIGFGIEDLKLTMYYLALTEPENIYIASVNIPWGSKPILQQHIHTAVLIPVINAENKFKDYVFESNKKTDADSFAKAYPNAHVHLVRIKVKGKAVFPSIKTVNNTEDKSFLRR